MNTKKTVVEELELSELEPKGRLRVPLSARQSRVRINTAKLAGTCCGLTGAAVSTASVRTAEDCVSALQELCLKVDSLRSRTSAAAGDVQWLLDGDSEMTAALLVFPAGPSSLADFLDSLGKCPETGGALAPLMVTYVTGENSRRTWFLAVGAARCDLSGLEQLICRWIEAIEGAPSSHARPPSLAAVQRALASAAESAAARSTGAYWDRQLDGFDESFSAEIAPRKAQLGEDFAPRPIRIEEARTLLKDSGRQHGMSQRTLLLAAWLLVVSRMVASTRAAVWLRADGRLAQGLREFIGHLSHYLPLSQRVEPNEACAIFLRDLDRTLAMHDRLQDSYFADAPSTAGGDLLAARELQFAYRDAAEPPAPAKIIERIEGGEPFRLRLCGECVGEDCEVILYFDSSSIRPVQAEYLTRHLIKVLRAMSDAQASLATVAAQLAEQYESVLRAERGAPRPEWIDRDRIGEMLTQGLRSCRVFATDRAADSEPFSARVMRRASYLRRLCSRTPAATIALVAPTSLEASVTTVAALYADIPVAFVDPRWPAPRRQQAIEKVGATLVISPDGTECPPNIPWCSIEQLIVAEATAGAAPAVDESQADPEAIAYVVFTSGSTGTPNPVLVPRRALQNQLLWLRERLPLDAADVLLHRTTLGFDAAIWELMHPICSGAVLAIPSHETASDPRTIVDEVVRHRVSVLQLTPHLLRAVKNEPAFQHGNDLRLIVCGGDRLLRELAEDVIAGQRFHIVNAYGPSECCIQVSIEDVTTEQLGRPLSSASVGTAMPNAGMHILTGDLKPVLDGSIGRLYISGTPLAHGYADDPTSTARAFVPMPGTSEHGLRMYDTGDLARRVNARHIEIIGRADQEMKLNGVRVNLLGVEQCLRQIDAVEEAAVVAASDEYGTGYLSAFLVTRGGADDVLQAARKRAAEVLPPTSQPAHYFCVAQFPLTDRGKIDRDALMKCALDATKPTHVPPRTPIEHTIAQVWKTVLNREDVGIHEDFFLSGGHSLLFAQVVVRLRQALSLDISLRAVFMHPTIALLAQHIEELQRNARDTAGQRSGGDEDGR
ncbi:MAG: non-ribosomal peptide synthetase [Xanthobacteraceae bacterium]